MQVPGRKVMAGFSYRAMTDFGQVHIVPNIAIDAGHIAFDGDAILTGLHEISPVI